jgi:hypothetical protein
MCSFILRAQAACCWNSFKGEGINSAADSHGSYG